MAHTAVMSDFELAEVRQFWKLSSLLKLRQHTFGPNDPQVVELYDDIRIMARHTDQDALRDRCRRILDETVKDAAMADVVAR